MVESPLDDETKYSNKCSYDFVGFGMKVVFVELKADLSGSEATVPVRSALLSLA